MKQPHNQATLTAGGFSAATRPGTPKIEKNLSRGESARRAKRAGFVHLGVESEAFLQWIGAHKQRAGFGAKGKRETAAIGSMPRYRLERELCEHMLADKEAHTGLDLGARPRDLPFAMFTEWRAPALPADDARPFTRAPRVDPVRVSEDAERCVTLWRLVLAQAASDLLLMWGATRADRAEALMFFEGPSEADRDARAFVADLAILEPGAIERAHKAGRLKAIAEGAVGRERYVTRRVNAQESAEQRDLFYSLGMR